ncbi:MAG: MlaE family ABC transporter permease, partial [Myxococcota bacterium]
MGTQGQQGQPSSPDEYEGRPSAASLGPASMALLSKAQAPPPSVWRVSISRLLAFVDHLGGFTLMTLRTVRAMFTPPFELRPIIYQLESVGVRSVSIASVTSVFIGMVMAVQFAISLQKFGAMEYTGRVVGLSFSRELAPTLTAVIVGGRVGAGMAAEVGSMAVTEQIDAIRALGADPIKKLVLPRVVALVFGMPVLAILALVFGFTGAMVVTSAQFSIPSGFFLRSAIDSVGMNDFL